MPVRSVGPTCREPNCSKPPYEAGRCWPHFALLGVRGSHSEPQEGPQGLNITPEQLHYAAACLRMDSVDDFRQTDLETVAQFCEHVAGQVPDSGGAHAA